MIILYLWRDISQCYLYSGQSSTESAVAQSINPPPNPLTLCPAWLNTGNYCGVTWWIQMPQCLIIWTLRVTYSLAITQQLYQFTKTCARAASKPLNNPLMCRPSSCFLCIPCAYVLYEQQDENLLFHTCSQQRCDSPVGRGRELKHQRGSWSHTRLNTPSILVMEPQCFLLHRLLLSLTYRTCMHTVFRTVYSVPHCLCWKKYSDP